ncbi:MAG: cupin domain-containing protein [Chloroflexi bacterium]|nr:cupin domain-containing protein [Chloroflexota bacterium]
MTVTSTASPYLLARDEAPEVLFLGTRTFVKATSAQTGGAFGLVEHVIPPGFSSPYHVHHAEDESFYVAEGQLTFVVDGHAFLAGPGAFVFGPREVPHGFRVEGDSPVRLLLLMTPAGFEQFILELSQPAGAADAPPAGPPDMAALLAVAAKYRADILGPLPA